MLLIKYGDYSTNRKNVWNYYTNVSTADTEILNSNLL
jgi:hypothetical protein